MLHAAIEAGDASKLQKILKTSHVNINERNRLLQTPLHAAIAKENIEFVRSILQKNPDVNAIDKENWTPLHVACSIPNVPIIMELLGQSKLQVNCQTKDGTSPLHYLARHKTSGDERRQLNEACNSLIARGADINIRTRHGESPLHQAVFKRNLGGVEYLVSKRCDINAVTKKGESALHFAVIVGSEEIIRFLIQSNIDQSIRASNGTAQQIAPPELASLFSGSPSGARPNTSTPLTGSSGSNSSASVTAPVIPQFDAMALLSSRGPSNSNAFQQPRQMPTLFGAAPSPVAAPVSSSPYTLAASANDQGSVYRQLASQFDKASLDQLIILQRQFITEQLPSFNPSVYEFIPMICTSCSTVFRGVPRSSSGKCPTCLTLHEIPSPSAQQQHQHQQQQQQQQPFYGLGSSSNGIPLFGQPVPQPQISQLHQSHPYPLPSSSPTSPQFQAPFLQQQAPAIPSTPSLSSFSQGQPHPLPSATPSSFSQPPPPGAVAFPQQSGPLSPRGFDQQPLSSSARSNSPPDAKPTPVPQIPQVPVPQIPQKPAPVPQIPQFQAPVPQIPQVQAPVPQIPQVPAPVPQIPQVQAPVPQIPQKPAPVPQVPQVQAPVPQIPQKPAPVPQIPQVQAPVPSIPQVQAPSVPSFPAPSPSQPIAIAPAIPSGPAAARGGAPAAGGDAAQNREAISKALGNQPLGMFAPKPRPGPTVSPTSPPASDQTDPNYQIPTPKNHAHQVHLTLKKGEVGAAPVALPGIGQGARGLVKRPAVKAPAPIPAEASIPFQPSTQPAQKPVPIPSLPVSSAPFPVQPQTAAPVPVPVPVSVASMPIEMPVEMVMQPVPMSVEEITVFNVPEIESFPTSFTPSQHANVKRAHNRDDLQNQLMSGLIYNGATYRPDTSLSESEVQNALNDLNFD